MRILVVTATDLEIAPLFARLAPGSDTTARTRTFTYNTHRIDVLRSGVGMVATAAWCARLLTAARYDLALNVGVCGSFDRRLAPGTPVHVTADRLAELGAEDDDRFLTIHDLQLLDENEFPFHEGMLVNTHPPANAALRSLPAVTGITVSTVHGRAQSIQVVAERFNPQVESMEGAAFMYACLIHGVPFAQVRAVSNIVEKRNRDAWRMPDAIRSLNETALRILNDA